MGKREEKDTPFITSFSLSLLLIYIQEMTEYRNSAVVMVYN